MANRNFPNSRLYSFNVMPVQASVKIPIGSTGAVGTISGPGIKAVVRLAAGIYRIQLQDNYKDLIQIRSSIQSPVTGSAVAMASLTPGVVYQIVTLGNSTAANWITAGLPAGITAAVGQVFKAAATSAGTATVKALGASGINTIEILGGNTMLAPAPSIPLSGGYVTIQCLGPTASGDTTPVATDPASGSTLYISMLLNNSSVQ